MSKMAFYLINYFMRGERGFMEEGFIQKMIRSPQSPNCKGGSRSPEKKLKKNSAVSFSKRETADPAPRHQVISRIIQGSPDHGPSQTCPGSPGREGRPSAREIFGQNAKNTKNWPK